MVVEQMPEEAVSTRCGCVRPRNDEAECFGLNVFDINHVAFGVHALLQLL